MKFGFALINDAKLIQIYEEETNKVAMKNLGSKLQVSCHYTHLPKGFDLEDISKSQIETVDFHLECISREEWNINFYSL